MDITSANCIYMLSIPNLYPVAQRLQGFAADAAFATEEVDTAETVMGVDGQLSAGFTPYITAQTITLQPDSPSLTIFELWASTQKSTKSIYPGAATIQIPSISKKYTMVKGVLRRVSPMPTAAKILQPMTYRIEWQDADPAPI
ncbi:phage tail fiber protein [Paraburkholderia caribensis]|uniref:phage tail fiber protein n=1 Tax=Paraburkholderia caribensis TaxID=75105 RepID=UPI001D065D04|nr:hypothetical protein [Paraburkholderia caribensis]